jgi:hypothetical protein
MIEKHFNFMGLENLPFTSGSDMQRFTLVKFLSYLRINIQKCL